MVDKKLNISDAWEKTENNKKTTSKIIFQPLENMNGTTHLRITNGWCYFVFSPNNKIGTYLAIKSITPIKDVLVK